MPAEERFYQLEELKADTQFQFNKRKSRAALSVAFSSLIAGLKEKEVTDSLKKNSEFQYVYRNGKSRANKYLVMYVIKNDIDKNRLGISVSKKVGNSVVRHRIARLFRESFRLSNEKFHSGWDIVVVARIAAKGKSFDDINSAFLQLAGMHAIIYK